MQRGKNYSCMNVRTAYLPTTPHGSICTKFGTAGLLADLITRGNFLAKGLAVLILRGRFNFAIFTARQRMHTHVGTYIGLQPVMGINYSKSSLTTITFSITL